MGNYGFTIILWVAIGLFVFNQWENRKKKRKQETVTTFSAKAKLSSGMYLSQNSLTMEDLAVECYYNKTLTAQDISYEPYIEEPLNNG